MGALALRDQEIRQHQDDRHELKRRARRERYWRVDSRQGCDQSPRPRDRLPGAAAQRIKQ